MGDSIKRFLKYIEICSGNFSKNFPSYIQEITKLLILHIVEMGEVQTGICMLEKGILSFFTIDPYNSNIELSLRCHSKGVFDLYFQYYDEDEGEFKEVSYNYNATELEELPKGLREILELTLQTGKPQDIKKNQLFI